jgi:septum formation protein
MVLPQPQGPPLQHTFHETTHVRFAPISNDEIDAYVAVGESFDKSGGYGVQGPAGAWVEGMEGCYFNVMGFPLHAFSAALAAMIEDGRLPL